MKLQGVFTRVVLAAIAAALLKLAFFPSHQAAPSLVPSAHAAGVVEWDDSRRIVTTSADGATTYVWDYDEKTKVRRYTIKGDKLSLETFKLD